MSLDLTPRAVVERFVATSARGAYDELADFYAEDAIIEMPFAPSEIPRVSQGRELFRTRFKSVEGRWTIDAIDPLVIHETANPEVVIAEFTIHRTIAATAEKQSGDYIMVMTIRDGLIIYSRDYANPQIG
jgi:ketosteroid isomerase-like protein